MRLSHRPFIAALLLPTCLLILLSGCGTAEYDMLLNKRLGELRSAAPFRVLWGPTVIPDTPIKIRVPLIFKKSYTPDSAHPEDGPKIKPDRVQPEFFPLPGLKLCYEGTYVSTAGTLPFYCYLAAIPSKPGDAEKVLEELLAALKKQFKDAPGEWEPVDALTPTGSALQWKKVRVTGPQTFRLPKLEKPDPVTEPALFELWLYDATDYIVRVGWRAALAVEGPNAVPVPGQPKPAYEPPEKLDLTSLSVLTAGSLTVDAAAAPAADAAAAQ